MSKSKSIKIEAEVKADIDKVWKYWTAPKHIVKWNSPSPDWHTPKAENEVKEGGRFTYRMEAKDNSVGFDFGGTYNEVKENKKLSYALDDDRKVEVAFEENEGVTKIIEVFEPENQNPEDMQRAGWQAILDNFKTYTENN